MMETKMMDTKLEGFSLDISALRRRQLLDLFPEVRAEGNKIDFERLRLALGADVDASKERYGLGWPGKIESLRIQPTMATLLPLPEKSVNFDSTRHAIIEGDNLEVLKLLQKSYLGKVKLIYIDPPYNTGNDFIYPDDYSETLRTYLEYTGQADSEGRRFGNNSDTNGRFHSKWLNMMLPRLALAWNLLRDDGFMMCSIDDNEIHNLRSIMDEIFGEDNFCGTFVWEKKKKPSFLHTTMGTQTEYIVVYSRDRAKAPPLTNGVVEQGKMYPFNNAGNPLATLTFPAASVRFGLADGAIESQDMSQGNIRTKLLDRLEIKGGTNVDAFRLEGEWRYSQRRLDEFVVAGDEIVIRQLPFRPNYISRSERDKKTANLLTVKGTGTPTYEDATAELRELFGSDIIEYPKPSGLLRFLVAAGTGQTDLILDFFAGSGTTAQAVLDINARDGGDRQFILVQLPEPTGREDYTTIADIAEERVRRAIGKLNGADNGKLSLDTDKRQDRGFRVFSLAQSNVKEWDASMEHDPVVVKQQLLAGVDHLRHGRTDLDIVYEVLLKSGYPLSAMVTLETIDSKQVYSVADGAFLICLERNLSLDLIRAIGNRTPERVLFLDEGFAGNDQLKTNAAQTFKTKNVVFRTL
jgi:adenine-specific DNA-methyltransferase